MLPAVGVSLETTFFISVHPSTALRLAAPLLRQSSNHSFLLALLPVPCANHSASTASAAQWSDSGVKECYATPSSQSNERLLAYTESAGSDLTFSGVLPAGCFHVRVYVATLPSASSNQTVRLLWTDLLNVTQGASTNSSVSACQLSAQTNTVLSASASSPQTALQTISTISSVASVTTAAGNASTANCAQAGQPNSTAANSGNSTVTGTLLTLLATTFTQSSVANLSQGDTYVLVTVAGNVLQQLTAAYVSTAAAPNSTLRNSSAAGGLLSQSASYSGQQMEQSAFDSATAVVQVILSVLSGGVMNASADVTSTVSSQLAASLGSMVQSSQSLLASGDDGAADMACSRFTTSVGQVQGLLNTTAQSLAANDSTSGDDSSAATSFTTAGFLASAWQVAAEYERDNETAVLSGGLPLSMPVDALSAVVGMGADMSVRVVQVSGVWAQCGAPNALNSSDGLANSLVAAAQSNMAVVSSNVVTIDITTVDGEAYEVSNLTQPITFQLVAPSADNATTSATVPACSWYDELSYGWSTAGCNTTLLSDADGVTTVLCSCSHLTDFGVIYADAKDAAALEAVVNGFAGYMVLLVWYILTCVVSGYQLSRLLNVAALKEKLMSRVISVIGKGSSQTSAYHNRVYAEAAPNTSGASSLVLIEHLLVFLISLCRGISMCVYYTFDTNVSFTAVSALSILPLVGNMWVFAFVIFQWSAIYYNAARGGGVGEADFSSNSIQRLRAVFYTSMSLVTALILCLLVAINQSHSQSEQEQLAFAGIIVTLVIVGVMSALLFSVGLMLVYSLTRDFTSKHATKLFLLALTFSCTLLGQSLVLVHQAVTVGDVYGEFNKDNMLYYGLDAVGHVLVLGMFAKSVQSATAQRRKHTSQASTTHASLKVVSSVQSSQASQLSEKQRGGKGVELATPTNRPSFHHTGSVSNRPKQLAISGSSKSGTTSVNQVQLATWERSTTGGGRVLPPLFTSPTFMSRTTSQSGNARQPWSPTSAPTARLGTLNDDEYSEAGPIPRSAPGFDSTSFFSSTSAFPVTAEVPSSPPARFARTLPPLVVPSSPSGARDGAWSPFRPLASNTRVAPLSSPSSAERAEAMPLSPSSAVRVVGSHFSAAYGGNNALSPISGHSSSWVGSEQR